MNRRIHGHRYDDSIEIATHAEAKARVIISSILHYTTLQFQRQLLHPVAVSNLGDIYRTRLRAMVNEIPLNPNPTNAKKQCPANVNQK